MLSNIPATQDWLSQFLPQDRPVACKLLDELIYIPTDRVIGDLKLVVESILKEYESTAIYPIRELLSEDESYFSLADAAEHPTMQHGQAAQGSEAFVSNLITRLNRSSKAKVILEDVGIGKYKIQASPSISTIRDKKIKTLILIDDLIGSGDRTRDFLEAVYKPPSIRSWVSAKYLKIIVVAFMATNKGKKSVEKWCKNEMKAKLLVINECPTFHNLPNNEEIFDLCKNYAKKGEGIPLGYDEVAVRVIFGHSAPNNIPAILHRKVDNYKAKSTTLRGRLSSWIPLFPSRDVPEQLKAQIMTKKKTLTIKASIRLLLNKLEQTTSLGKDKLFQTLEWPVADWEHYVALCLKLNMITENGDQLKITEQGRRELEVLNRMKYTIEFNTKNYYPSLIE
ncbi:phosphoribosyltransferase-like protein [Shewanella sp. 0m-8]